MQSISNTRIWNLSGKRTELLMTVPALSQQKVLQFTVPEFRLVEKWADDHGVKYDSRESLCNNPEVKKMIMERLETLQQGLASYEQVKRITLLTHHFSMESSELTNTLKIKRGVIYKNYKDIIDKMYED